MFRWRRAARQFRARVSEGFPVRFTGGVSAVSVTATDSIGTDATSSLDAGIAGGGDESGVGAVSLGSGVTDGLSVCAGPSVTVSVVSTLDVSARASGVEDRATVTLGSCITGGLSVRAWSSALSTLGRAAVADLSVPACTIATLCVRPTGPTTKHRPGIGASRSVWILFPWESIHTMRYQQPSQSRRSSGYSNGTSE